MRPLGETLLQTDLSQYQTQAVSPEMLTADLLGYESPARSPERYARVITELSLLARQYTPDLILPASPALSPYARRVGQTQGVSFMRLQEDELTGEPRLCGTSQSLISRFNRIVIVDTVLCDRTAVQSVLRLPNVLERTVGLVAIWDCGRDDERAPLPAGIGQSVLVEQYIPRMRTPGSAVESTSV